MPSILLPDYLGAHRFTHELWMQGTLRDIGVFNRVESVRESRHLIRQVAIGYHSGHDLPFRPKKNCVALMMFTDCNWWTHVTNQEFKIIFPEIKLDTL